MAADVVSTRRSAARPPTPAPNARALTAAATVLDPTDRAQAAKIKSYRQDWQRHAWDFYECLSADTEILTRDHGWLTYDLLQVGDLVLTLDPESGTSGWEPVESIHVHPVEGIPVLSMESNRHSSLSTLDHRWPVSARLAGYRDRGPRWRTSATLRGADLIRTAAPCRDLSDDPKWTDAFVEVVGWFWTEGTIKPSPRGTTYSVTIYQSRSANPAYVDRIRLALTKAFGPPSESLWRAAKSATAAWREQIVAGSEITRFRLNNLAAAQLTAVAPGRVVDRAFIRELTAAQLELFVAVSMMADGNADGRSLGQKSTAALSAFEYACILSGRGVVTRQYEPTITQLRVSRRTETTVESREIQEYSGTVWCPRTASATWLARRNGTVFYTGNTLPEIHFGHDYYGNVVSRVRLFAGFQVDPDDPPIPLDEIGEDGEMPEGANPETADAAVEEMRRLDQGSDGGLGGLAGDLAVNLALAGEGTIHGTEDPESQTGERFCVYSVEELKAVGEQGYQIFAKGTSMGREVGADDYVLRVWRRHRRFRDLADAPMRALLDTCDNLLLLTRVLYAASASRMHGGIFVAPAEWSFPQRKTDGNAQSQANDDPLTEQIVIQTTTPIQSPKNGTSVAPLVLRGPADTLDKARWIDLGRGYGKELLEQIEMVRRGIAVGLDLPVEVLEGLGDSNHWSAWQIDQDTFRAHVEPLVLMICRALTEGWLWLNLRARGLDPTGFVVGFDATALTGHPDLFNNMQTMHERFAVSDDALRRAGGASDDDAPDEEEVARRLWIEQQKRLTIRETGDAPPGEIQEDPGNPPNAQDTPKAAPPNPLTDQGMAASGARDLRTLGTRLEQIDRDLRARIQTLADAALHRALEKAGASVIRKLRASQGRKGSSSGLAAEIRAMKTSEIPMLLGREQLTSMGLDEDKLIDGELGDLETKYRELTRRALTGALLMGRRHVPSGDLDDEEVTRQVQGQERWVAGGFAVLSAAVLAGAHEQLFNGPPNPSGPGEVDLTARVDPGAVRESLAVAGGAQVAAVSSEPAGGVATGQIVMDAFREALQILPQGWQWVYGYPDKPFEPHENLEGVEFSAWDDEILLNGESWPDTPYFFPGDHLSCSCSFVPMFASDRPDDEPEEG